MLVRELRVRLDQSTGHDEVLRHPVGVVFAQRLQLDARLPGQITCLDLVRDDGVVVPRTDGLQFAVPLRVFVVPATLVAGIPIAAGGPSLSRPELVVMPGTLRTVPAWAVGLAARVAATVTALRALTRASLARILAVAATVPALLAVARATIA